MLLTHGCCSSLTRLKQNQICWLLTIDSSGHTQVSRSYALSTSVPEITVFQSSSPRFWCFTQIPQSPPNPPASKPAAMQENTRHHRWEESSPYMLSLLRILPTARQAQQNCRGTAARPRQRVPQFCHHHMKAEHTVLLLLCSKTPSLPSEEQQVKSFIRLKGCNGAAFLMTIKKQTNAGYDSNIRCHGLSPSQECRIQKDSNIH